MVRVLVKTPEGQQAGPVSQVEHPVDTLLGLVVDPCLEQMVEALAEAQKARLAEEVVHMEWVVAPDFSKGHQREAPLEMEGALWEPC